ncbi:hypothetical protein EWM64_g1954 [Hericium alpestre]|uniref:Mitochondrial escape protein 2 n=1 Tax=Hericium alpestre TaxID=135208 RepID=A0A4Z0A6S9_9AGAM|nr:hypothetical protein EWM64_g1954 [Hericium alpestre]
MLHTILKDSGRPVLEIDIDVLLRAQSEAQIVDALAKQTGYWPVFTALNSLNHLVDLASVGLIGQKAGLSSTLSDQLEHILTLVTSALRDVAATREKAIQHVLENERRERQQKEEEAQTRARIAKGVWWDPRMGYVAGGGVMAELACGDEPFTVADEDVDAHLDLSRAAKETGLSEKGGAGRNAVVRDVKDGQDIRVLPIVVLRNFKGGKEEITGVFAEWVARLIEVQVAHVIVVSDNRNHSRQLAKVLPTKPLNVIALYDADAATALKVVQQRLRETNTDITFMPEQEKLIGYLGGRASDLTFLIRKLRGGTSVEEAVEESITNGMSELRKNVFGDDADDVKSLPWTNEQAWVVLHALAKRDEVPYHDMLVDFPFKGDEAALRSMEQTDFIAIGTVNGRPSVIKPGKPIYRHVFERLASDAVFQANQDLALNTKRIQIAQDIIAACEQELKTLNELSRGSEMRTSWLRPWADRPTTRRIRYLLQKMRTAETTVESLDKKNSQLKAVLKKGDS